MRIVLVRLSALGDIVHTWPLAEAIRAARPDAHLTWVVEAPFAPLVDGHPAVDAVLTTATRRWRKRPFAASTGAEIGSLKSRFHELAPDLAIDAQGTFKSAAVTHWTGAPRRVGLARPWRRELIAGIVLNETIDGSSASPHVVATNLELVRAVGGSPPGGSVAPDGRWLLERVPAAHVLPWAFPFAVLLPGAGQADKILSPVVLAETADHLVRRGLTAVVAWGPGERKRAEEVLSHAGDGVVLAPETDLLELAGLLAAANMVVGGDTGPVHLAAALGVPTLAVFLTTDPDRNGLLGPRVGVVSGAAAGRGPGGSATTGHARDVPAVEIRAAVDDLLASQD
jgi:lipopolysaccharide heptosyltransferase I